MPFEISPDFRPVEVPTRVGRFQQHADAMLRGAAVTPWTSWIRHDKGATCALGAMQHGLGEPLGDGMNTATAESMEREAPLLFAYREHYGTSIADDNNSRRFTREEIAARIAAL